MEEPALDDAAELAVGGFVRYAELLDEASFSEEGDAGWFLGRPGAPDEPCIEVEFSGGVGEKSYGVEVDGNGMPFELVPEGLAEENVVLEIVGRKLLLIEVLGVPDLHAVEEMKAGVVIHGTVALVLLGAEKDGGAEDAAEAVDEASVLAAIFG